MGWWIMVRKDGRAAGDPVEVDGEPVNHMMVEVSNPEHMTEKFRGEYSEFRVEDGMLVFDPTPEQEADFKRMAFDPYRAATEQDAAICELYEMIAGEQL